MEDGDAFLSLAAGTAWSLPLKQGVASVGDGLFEASIWVDEGGAASLVVRAGPAAASGGRGHRIVRTAGGGASGLDLRRGTRARSAGTALEEPAAAPARALVAAPCVAAANCSFGPLLNGSDICPGGSDQYRDLSVQGEADPLAACAAACCAWEECTAYIVRPFSGTDRNCTDTLCCWMKPQCYANDTTPNPSAISSFRTLPPGPPLPARVRGYNISLDTASDRMTLSRDDGSGAPPAVLGAFDLTTLENGLVRGAWNILRVLLETDAASGTLSISVFFNPMLPETG